MHHPALVHARSGMAVAAPAKVPIAAPEHPTYNIKQVRGYVGQQPACVAQQRIERVAAGGGCVHWRRQHQRRCFVARLLRLQAGFKHCTQLPLGIRRSSRPRLTRMLVTRVTSPRWPRKHAQTRGQSRPQRAAPAARGGVEEVARPARVHPSLLLPQLCARLQPLLLARFCSTGVQHRSMPHLITTPRPARNRRARSIDADTQATATFLAKADGVLAGLAVADTVFEMVDPSLKVRWSKQGAPGARVALAAVWQPGVRWGSRQAR